MTVIYDNSNFDAYKEAAREELEENGNANPTEKEISSEVDFLIRNDWHNVKPCSLIFLRQIPGLQEERLGAGMEPRLVDSSSRILTNFTQRFAKIVIM